MLIWWKRLTLELQLPWQFLYQTWPCNLLLCWSELLQKIQFKDEIRRTKEFKKQGKDPATDYGNLEEEADAGVAAPVGKDPATDYGNLEEEADVGAAAPVAVPLPNMALPPSSLLKKQFKDEIRRMKEFKKQGKDYATDYGDLEEEADTRATAPMAGKDPAIDYGNLEEEVDAGAAAPVAVSLQDMAPSPSSLLV
ncbi:unnamed protein product [Fraxinus pennsylvanica]|uniref:Uncharacterized protein n=1 Tax=Fraxinus pennsylvanica TaxID=56036 RepID=A0AAD2A3S4_9LAMI|nr:unnamed protein product [Fraxinus pennsylvanica]